MLRTSSIYYISPLAISIIPNANKSANDLSVYVARGTRIKVYSPQAGIGMVNGAYQEWTVAGRNRRLNDPDGTKEFTIYLRLPKDNTAAGYLTFVAKDSRPEGLMDRYCYVTENGLTSLYQAVTGGSSVIDYLNWWVKLGTVSAPNENGQRTVDLDTGILGTVEYNSKWRLNPDNLPDKQVRVVTTDRGQWTDTPKVTYLGETGKATPDGTLSDSVAVALGWTGTEELTFMQGQSIDEPYHADTITRHRWLSQRLAADNASLTDADLYAKLTGPTKGWEVENELETSRVWRGGKFWECLADGTTLAPQWESVAWKVIGGDTTLNLKFYNTDTGAPYGEYITTRPANINIPVTPHVFWGTEDISEHIDSWQWNRIVNNVIDSGWAGTHNTQAIAITVADMPTGWSAVNPAIFECVATVLEDGETVELVADVVI